ncbi:hypothetical protein O181_119192, partial [Austropuccinia psidii MF-1]|nr:hypothetical protein [Austropuccinia psidii MF-1]
MSPTLLIILTLAVPAQHASAPLPSLCSQCPHDMPPLLLTILTLCPPNMPLTTLTILTLTVTSRHASNATYHPYAQVQWLVGVHDERNQGDILSGHLCQQVLGGN